MKSFFIILFIVCVASYFSFINNKLTFKSVAHSEPKIYLAGIDEILKSQFLLNGKVVTLGELKNKYHHTQLVIHFWATWCAPCLAELPQLYKYALKNKKVGFVFIAVNDEQKEIDKFLKKIKIDKNELGYWLIDNNQESYNVFRVDKIPETYLVREENQVSRLVGAQTWK